MKSVMDGFRFVWLSVMALALLAVAASASPQWTPVVEIPATRLFAVFANGDTIVAGADTAVYVSTNSGLTWKRSAKPVAGVAAIDAVWIRNRRLYAGTFGQGVHVSDDPLRALRACHHGDCLAKARSGTGPDHGLSFKAARQIWTPSLSVFQ